MVDIQEDLKRWLQEGKQFALATVIKTWRSAPRAEGAAMAICQDGTMIGSVSGGCVEGAVVEDAMKVIQAGISKKLAFGVSDEDAWSVGLSCGGQIEIWLEKVNTESDLWNQWSRCIRENRGCLWVTHLSETPAHALYYHQKLHGNLPDNLQEVCAEAYRQHKTQVYEDKYFLNVFPAKSRMIIIGAAHVSLDLLRLAHIFNFETIVIDPRGIFTKEERFDIKPHHIYQQWPAEVLPDLTLDADTYVIVLTHDPKIDDQALQIVLASDVAYIGALGSRKTHEKRKHRLADAGLTSEQIDRIHGPVGVAINARQPAEIALSIMAQVIQEKNKFL